MVGKEVPDPLDWSSLTWDELTTGLNSYLEGHGTADTIMKLMAWTMAKQAGLNMGGQEVQAEKFVPTLPYPRLHLCLLTLATLATMLSG